MRNSFSLLNLDSFLKMIIFACSFHNHNFGVCMMRDYVFQVSDESEMSHRELISKLTDKYGDR